MEFLDLINGNDEVVGKVSRSDAHNNASLTHRAVHFTLIDPVSHSVMVSRRAFSKKHDGGILCFLGEHVLSGEDYEDATQRGAKEELGIDVTKLFNVGEHVFSDENFSERIKMFLIEYRQNKPLQPDPAEIAEICWYTRAQLRTILVSTMAQYWLDNIDWTAILA